jgi:hypothetical protein
MHQLLALAQAIRPHQWAKNALVALPLLAAHQLDDLTLLLMVIAGFGAFCLVASACLSTAMIWLAVNRDLRMWNLLSSLRYKRQLITSIIFLGDYRLPLHLV